MRLHSAALAAAAVAAGCGAPAGPDIEPKPVEMQIAVVGRVTDASGEPVGGIAVHVRRVEALNDTLPGRCSRTTFDGADSDAVYTAKNGGYSSAQPWGSYCVLLYGIRDGTPVRLSSRAVEVYYANVPDTLFGRLPRGPGRWERAGIAGPEYR